MSNHPAPPTATATDTPTVVDGELVPLDDVMPRPLHHPPAVRTCVCGNTTIGGHNGYSCQEILEIRARVEGAVDTPAWLSYVAPVGGVLVGLGVGAVAVWLVVLGVAAVVTAVVVAVSAVVAWISTYWPLALVGLLFLGGGAKCVGLHCGGCRG